MIGCKSVGELRRLNDAKTHITSQTVQFSMKKFCKNAPQWCTIRQEANRKKQKIKERKSSKKAHSHGTAININNNQAQQSK